MPGEGALVRPGDRIPETDGIIPLLPDASVRPSGLNATLLTPKRMPGEGALVRPGDRIPQTDGIIASLPDASVRPSGLNATL